MGMFDSIYFVCPNCGERIEEQTKAGACNLDVYEGDEVPAHLAVDIEGQIVDCDTCNHSFRIEFKNNPPPAIPMHLVKIEKGK